MACSSLSDDLVLDVLDYLDFRGVLRYSHVSRHCRSLARSHPTYWKSLLLADPVTKGQLALFLDRLAAKSAADASITLTLKFVTPGNDFSQLIIPALRAHLHRVAVLTVLISPNAPEALWELFRLSTPQLRRLKVVVIGQGSCVRLLPSVFDVHVHRRLESVVLIDAALPPDLIPLSHAIKDITVFSTVQPIDLRRTLEWAPRTAALGLWRLTAASLPSQYILSTQQRGLTSVKHISLHGGDWLSVLLSLVTPETLPSLTIRISQPTPSDVLAVLPAAPRLCVCVKQERDASSGFLQAPSGVVAVTTPERDVLRVFEHVGLGYLVSDAFIRNFVPYSRIETLVISLDLGFAEMCQGGHNFPHLRTLCLGLSYLPESPETWKWGSISCPELHTLAFQQEYDSREASISTSAIRSFVLCALSRTAISPLCIVLKGVKLTDTATEKERMIHRIMYRPPRAPWHLPGPYHFSCRNRFPMSWLDI